MQDFLLELNWYLSIRKLNDFHFITGFNNMQLILYFFLSYNIVVKRNNYMLKYIDDCCLFKWLLRESAYLSTVGKLFCINNVQYCVENIIYNLYDKLLFKYKI